MSSKAILRLLIGCALAALFLIFLLPAIGIPKSYLLPPATVLNGATGKTVAFVSKKTTGGTTNPFKSGEIIYYITYRYRVTPPQNLLDKPTEKEMKTKRLYYGRAAVPEDVYHSLRNPEKVGDPANDAKPETVPVRFEKTRPDISEMVLTAKYPNTERGGALFGSWMLFVLGIFVLGYIIAPFLQRIFLREDY